MSEPMVSHDCVAFYLLSEEVAQAPQGRPVRPGRRRGVRRLLLVPAAGRGRRRTPPTYRDAFVDRPHAEMAEVLGPAAGGGRLRARSWRPRSPAVPSAVDAGLRLDTEVMLVDDPVKRVDNMTMAHGLEARTPFLDHELVELAAPLPAGAQARPRRQGHPQGGRARDRPRRGHRPPEGLLPRARAVAPRGRRARAGARGARGLARSCARSTASACSPTPTASARRSTAPSSGSSRCSSSG